MARFLVEDVTVGSRDSTGTEILTVYGKISQRYAVYRTKERVVIQYADDDDKGVEQRIALAALNCPKGEINGLIDGWRASRRKANASKAKIFDRRVADALLTGLQGSPEQALDDLKVIKADILEERTSVGRTLYMIAAVVTMVVALLTFWLFSASWAERLVFPFDDPNYWEAAAMGAIGAVFSIALQIRSRNVPTDLQSRDNYVDAGLRVMIGATSGAILFGLLAGHVVTFGLGGKSNFDFRSHEMLIVIPFIAGFAERLVSDFIGAATLTGGRATNALAGTDPARATKAAGSGRDEKNMLVDPDVARAGKEAPPAAPAVAAAADPDNDDRDCCVAGQTLTAAEMTDDTELPEAIGGVEAR